MYVYGKCKCMCMVKVLKHGKLVACQKGLDKQRRPSSDCF